jgi:hypothetical protein
MNLSEITVFAYFESKISWTRGELTGIDGCGNSISDRLPVSVAQAISPVSYFPGSQYARRVLPLGLLFAMTCLAGGPEPVRTLWILFTTSEVHAPSGGVCFSLPSPSCRGAARGEPCSEGGQAKAYPTSDEALTRKLSVPCISAAGLASFERIRPDVHSVEVTDQFVTVRSAGIPLRYFGLLQAPPLPNSTIREFVFRIPRHPKPEHGRHERVPIDITGVFANGLPIYNQFETLSYNAANLWHYDPVATNDDGTLTAAGHPRAELTHPSAPGLLEQLIAAQSRHSPLIGFALDGYPIYGPWGYANGAGGELRRMRSSYRLRSVSRRHDWADGTQLTPEQFGPDVGATNPLGTFAEDYEYAPGSGDLDQFNGRFTVTPEYPQGTYAYFLTTDSAGRLAFPYLIGPRFYGHTQVPDDSNFTTLAKRRLEMKTDAQRLHAGTAVHFRLEARDSHGEPIRDFEYVHERPIHFLIASADLVEFDHIHPELVTGDAYEVSYTFAHGGAYRIWADYSLPGEPPHLDRFDVTVEGANRAPQKLAASASLTQTAGPLSVELVAAKPLRAGEDIPIGLKLTGTTDNLEPYLGAWAHIIVVSENLRSYAHAHPVEAATTIMATQVHTHIVTGPPPPEIHITTSFPEPGLYKLWAQFQLSGKVLTVPFVLRAGPAASVETAPVAIPKGAIRVMVTQQGYQPARLQIPSDKPVTLAFTRESEPNCGSEVVFPKLNIRTALPLGQTILVQLPAQAAGEMAFSCGTGMFRGMIVAR